MSVSVSVFLKDDRLPTPTEWQAAIRGAGFAVELDTDFDPRTFTGFLPATYRGLAAGFEYYLDEVAGTTDLGSERRVAAASGQELYVTLVTHSSMAETLSATLAAAVLAEVTAGTLFDDESDEAHPGASATAWARSQEAEGIPFLDGH
jgi:hypothetical protein